MQLGLTWLQKFRCYQQITLCKWNKKHCQEIMTHILMSKLNWTAQISGIMSRIIWPRVTFALVYYKTHWLEFCWHYSNYHYTSTKNLCQHCSWSFGDHNRIFLLLVHVLWSMYNACTRIHFYLYNSVLQQNLILDNHYLGFEKQCNTVFIDLTFSVWLFIKICIEVRITFKLTSLRCSQHSSSNSS